MFICPAGLRNHGFCDIIKQAATISPGKISASHACFYKLDHAPRYLLMVDAMKRKEERRKAKREKMAKVPSTDKAEKKLLKRQQAESVDEPDIKQEVRERVHFATPSGMDTPPMKDSVDLNSQFKGANARFRRRLKDKLEETKDKLEKKPKLKAMLKKVKRQNENGDTTDDGESEDAGED